MIGSFSNLPVAQKRAKRSTDAAHPIFQKCAELADQHYWREKFLAMSRNKFSRGIRFLDGNLIIKRKNKSVSCKVPTDPQEAEPALRKFMQSFNILSSEDKAERAKRAAEKHMKTRAELFFSWNKIKLKPRWTELHNYCLKLKREMGLTDEQARDLLVVINMGLLNGVFNADTIILENGYISKITGLKYDKQTGLFFIDPKQVPKKTRTNKPGKGKIYDPYKEGWEKFCKAHGIAVKSKAKRASRAKDSQQVSSSRSKDASVMSDSSLVSGTRSRDEEESD